MAKSGSGQGGPSSGRRDPDSAFSFFVEIDGIQTAKFAEARGLEWKADTVSFFEGGNPRHKVNLVGPGNFTPLTLKKGFFATSGEFFNWMKAIMNPNRQPMERSTVSVVACSDAGDEIGRYNLYGAFMTKYSGPGFNAGEAAIGFEEIEITYDYFDFEPGKASPGAGNKG
ncbi:MAG: phage tail protein [Deltaproteobacteria bacterium]|nr:phage tail protein [Deltaproteobacteria bacterium]